MDGGPGSDAGDHPDGGLEHDGGTGGDGGSGDGGARDGGQLDDAGEPEDAGPEFPFDGGPAPLCEDAQLHNGGDGVCVPVGTCSTDFFLRPDGRCTAWRQTSPLPQPSAWLRLVAHSNDLYAVGTFDFGLAPRTDARTRLVDGELEAWTPIPTPEPRVFFSGATIFDDRLVLAGGQRLPHLTETADITIGTIEPDGSVSSWVIAPNPLSIARVFPAAFLMGNDLVVSGGCAEGGALSSFEFLPVSSDGTLGSPSLRGATPDSVCVHHAFVLADGVMLAGGVSSSPGNYWTWTSGDPGLEEWITRDGIGATMGPCVVTAGSSLVAIGGYRSYPGIGSKPGGLVFIAHITAGPSVGQWRSAGIMNLEHTVADCAVVGDFVVVAGGSVGPFASTDIVSIAKTDAVLRSVEEP